MGGCFKLKEGFRLDAWKKYFTQRVVKQWYRLARKVVDYQIRWGPQQPGLMDGNPVHGRVIWNRLYLMYLLPQHML